MTSILKIQLFPFKTNFGFDSKKMTFLKKDFFPKINKTKQKKRKILKLNKLLKLSADFILVLLIYRVLPTE